MDDQNNTRPSWQTGPPAPHNQNPVPDHYTPYAHQIPDHGSSDPTPIYPQPPVPVYQPPAPQPAYTPPAPMPTQSPVQEDAAPMLSSNSDRPVPVVRVLSVRGIEYAMMSILLWFWSASLIITLVTIIMGGPVFSELAFPIALLSIGVPGFAFFYIRLRRAELRDPSLRLEASKRRFSQITQILAFLTIFFNLVALVFVLISAVGGTSTTSIPKFIGATVVVLLVAGGILAYYWLDEHKLVRR